MPAHLTPARKTVYGTLAWSLSLAGFSAPQVAKEIERQYGLAISEKTVDRLITQQQTLYVQENVGEVEQARLLHAARMERIWQHAWGKIDHPKIDPKDESAFLRVARSAANDAARAAGVFVERIDVRTQSEVLIRKYVGVDVDAI